jgi:hypothetical protein
MKTTFVVFCALSLAVPVAVASADSESVLQCAGNLVGSDGVRVNLIRSAKSGLRANLIFGTTVSGQMYRVQPTAEGFKGDRQGLPMELRVSSSRARNKYIDGRKASLEVTFVDLRNPSGQGRHSTKLSDQFVCGKQIRPYRQ